MNNRTHANSSLTNMSSIALYALSEVTEITEVIAVLASSAKKKSNRPSMYIIGNKTNVRQKNGKPIRISPILLYFFKIQIKTTNRTIIFIAMYK